MTAFAHPDAATFLRKLADDLDRQATERDEATDRRSGLEIDPAVQGGAPCFAGTRIPARQAAAWIADGCTVDEFLYAYPGVTRRQVLVACWWEWHDLRTDRRSDIGNVPFVTWAQGAFEKLWHTSGPLPPDPVFPRVPVASLW